MNESLLNESLLIDMLKCARCGKCRALCPSFKENKWETSSARGRVLLSLGLMQNKIPMTKRLISDIFSCFICKQCSELCPSAVDVPRIIENTRTLIHKKGLTPSPIQLILDNLDESKNIFNMDQEDRLLWTMNVEELIEDRICKPAEIGFFVGCLESFKGSLGVIPEALILIMDALKIDFTILGEEEWCCGNPYFIAGDSRHIANQFAEHNIQKMAALKVKTVVTTCPGCYRVWSSIYPVIYGTLPFQILHSTQLLAQLITKGELQIKNPLPQKIVFQDPCELGRHCGVYDAPRKILSNIPKIRLFDFENSRENSECCGGGGLVKAVHPNLAKLQCQNKIKQYLSNKIDQIITACPSCLDNYLTSLESNPETLTIRDLHELIAELLDLL
ncbi:MAG: (Fe-S)-binding protein [Candidatus Helarchaeota archaeon]